MSFVIAAPDLVAMATEDLAGIGASLTAANAAAAVPTSGLLAAAGDEVSAAIAALFSSHGQQYQAMSAQAAAFHARFVQALAGAMGAYAAAEAANASPLQTLEQGLLGAINAPAAALSGRPFIGNGTNGAPGTGEAGGPGGWLLGNGGNGGSGAPGQTGGARAAALAGPVGPRDRRPSQVDTPNVQPRRHHLACRRHQRTLGTEFSNYSSRSRPLRPGHLVYPHGRDDRTDLSRHCWLRSSGYGKPFCPGAPNTPALPPVPPAPPLTPLPPLPP